MEKRKSKVSQVLFFVLLLVLSSCSTIKPPYSFRSEKGLGNCNTTFTNLVTKKEKVQFESSTVRSVFFEYNTATPGIRDEINCIIGSLLPKESMMLTFYVKDLDSAIFIIEDLEWDMLMYMTASGKSDDEKVVLLKGFAPLKSALNRLAGIKGGLLVGTVSLEGTMSQEDFSKFISTLKDDKLLSAK